MVGKVAFKDLVTCGTTLLSV